MSDDDQERELKLRANDDDLDSIYGKSIGEGDEFSQFPQADQAVENPIIEDNMSYDEDELSVDEDDERLQEQSMFKHIVFEPNSPANLPQAAQATDEGGPQDYSLFDTRRKMNGGYKKKGREKTKEVPVQRGLTSDVKLTKGLLLMTSKFLQANRQHLKREFKLAKQHSMVTWPRGGFQRTQSDGSQVPIVSYADVQNGDWCVVADGKFKSAVLVAYNVSFYTHAPRSGGRNWTDREVEAFNEHRTIPERAKRSPVYLKMSLKFANPREVQMKLDNCINPYTHRRADGEAHGTLQEWKEKVARAGSLKCALCGIRCGAPWRDAEGKILYHVLTRHFEHDGIHEDHVSAHEDPKRKQYELDNGMAQWLCCMCHSGKASAESIRPKLFSCPAGDKRGFPWLQSQEGVNLV